MIIAIDAFPLAGRIAGIGRYVLEICRALDDLMPKAEFILYSPKPLGVKLPSSCWQIRVGGCLAAGSYVWLKTAARTMAEADGAQVFWATRTILPGRSRAFRTVSTVHDLNYRIFPRSMPHVTLLAHRLWFARDVRRADAVVTNSRGTAARLREALGVTADAVAPPGVGAPFGPQAQTAVAARLEALGVCQPYFLAVGTVEPRKNLPMLVEAFVSLRHAGELSEYSLLIAGSRGWRDRRLRALLGDAAVQGVRWLGFVSDDDLAALYAGAAAFVFPSLYEGFGIPAAEAHACGTQVIASNLPELRESAGIDGIYIEPTVAGLREGLLRAASKPIRSSSKEALSSWEAAAKVMVSQFQSLA